MKNYKSLYLLFCLTLLSVTMSAQTDATSYITNPSFENDMTGWVHKSMGIQNNNVFNIKDGNIYVEKWTGRGGAVGNGSVSQELQGLPPGNYELSAVAQNIQEDTPDAKQTGAYVFAGDKKTTVTVRDTYKVAFTCVTGKVTIGFEAVSASGNWIAVDNFRLTLVGQDLTNELNAAIESAVALYGDGTGKEAAQLLTAINAARAALKTSEGDAQAEAYIALEDAVGTYRRANASTDNPLDMTSLITNPSFEKDGTTGWTSTNMGTQGNNVFSIKDGNTYLERWTGRGGAVGDARISQTLANMPAGRYQLKAVAQNIQEDTPTKAQTGAWIFANTNQTDVTVRKDYTLEFVLVSNQLEIGFNAEGATGNWLAVDNFRLFYISDNVDDVKNELSTLIAKAEALAAEKTNATAHDALQTTINDAKAALNNGQLAEWGEAARKLEAAYKTAETSKGVFARLKAAIDEAQNILDKTSLIDVSSQAEYQTAINAAQSVYDGASTTDAKAEKAITALANATFAFRVANGTGTIPRVTTDKRFVRGATWAFGRSTVSASDIIEEGFCWSTNPDPKVTDNRTTEYINQAGKVYWLRDLKPSTVYYMRAYAMTKNYAVGYGDVLKVVTIPKGTMGWWYNNGGDEEVNARLNNAIGTAVDYYWNNLSSIHGMGLSVSYSPGTPTADCSYGGNMRVGASSAYQQVGTIMHEAFHAIGVGQHGNWWSGDYRQNGVWLGDRVTEALRFWDNSNDEVLSGDDMHLWPYGCNGAQEDTHNDNLYCMMGILAQALNEDGLPASGEIGYALPYYAFNHEDGVKYYIKNEDESHGLHSAYLVETASHALQWKTMDAEEATEDDAAAWYLTFTPGNQYYQLRNAASGYYMTYSGGIKTARHTTPTSADNFHLMRGRVNVDGHRGYYIIHPESTGNPPALNATASGKTATAGWSISNSATTQRWLILTAHEAEQFDNGNAEQAKKDLENLLAQIRKLAETPHVEDADNVDATLSSTLSDIEAQAATCTKGKEFSVLTEQAGNAATTFLSNVSATDVTQPFDLTFMIENPDFDKDATSGWTSTNGAPNYGGKAAEFYEKTFNYYQILDNMPSGYYQLRAYAFQRPGSYNSVLTPYNNGTAKVTSSLYINNTSAAVKHICDDRQSRALYTGDGYDQKLSDGTYIPNTMTGASKYFAKELYDSSVSTYVDKVGGSVRVGIKCTSAPSSYWTMFDHFRLYFFGGNSTVVGIENVNTDMANRVSDSHQWYDLGGRKITEGKLRRGIYIVGGKKVVVK